MTVSEAVRTRKSVRAFLDKAVEPEKLRRVMETARLAPSARNGQEWRFVIVQDPDARRKLIEAANNQSFVGEAPVLIVACAETDRRVMSCGHQAFPIDVAIALDHLSLAAVEEGLGTCWIGAFDPDVVRRILGIPKDTEVVELMPLGYPADPSPVEKNRLSYDEIVHMERW